MAKQPIKYWSTDVAPARSASQLLDLLVQYGAERTSVEWDSNRQPTAIAFAIRDPKHGLIPVRIAARIDDVIEAVRKMKGVRIDREKARRIAWRHLKDLVEQQLVSVSLGMNTLTETFFANVQIGAGSGEQTLGEWVNAALGTGQVPREIDGRLQLPPTTGRDL